MECRSALATPPWLPGGRRSPAASTPTTPINPWLPHACLGIPLMCCHTPADNSVNAFLQARCDELDEDSTLDDILSMLKGMPEYREGVIRGNGPRIFQGDPGHRAGKIMVDMTGRHQRSRRGHRSFGRRRGRHHPGHAHGGGTPQAGGSRPPERGHRRSPCVGLSGDEPDHRRVRARRRRRSGVLRLHEVQQGVGGGPRTPHRAGRCGFWRPEGFVFQWRPRAWRTR